MRDLRHSSDEEPGFSRIRRGKGWSYHDHQGRKVEDRDIIDRLNGLAVPPAYDDVWFCRDEDGHVQATGVDEKGRKQYLYHEGFRDLAEEKKFARCAEFGRTLPRIRKNVAKDLRRRSLQKDTVLAAVVRLLDQHHLRIGNQTYAKRNGSFGATTLRRRHLEQLKTRVKLNFRAKHGATRDVTVTDAALVRILGECQELPGQHLFQWVDDSGANRIVDSQDVNDYLRRVSRSDFTAKHFRTWGASAMAMQILLDARKSDEKITLKGLVEPVADMLGNTPAVTRSSYIHPELIDRAKDSPLDPLAGFEVPRRKKRRLSREETALLKLLDDIGPPPGWKRRLIRRLFNR